jgi:GrpB-like predicted nucleotidyltransferase (UPF0157 family)
MNEAQLLQQAIDEPVRLAEYDPAWPARFDAERSRLRERFPAELIEVQHIGSTAIPGMPAKPIIDVMVGVACMAVADALFEPILDHGYVTSRGIQCQSSPTAAGSCATPTVTVLTICMW